LHVSQQKIKVLRHQVALEHYRQTVRILMSRWCYLNWKGSNSKHKITVCCRHHLYKSAICVKLALVCELAKCVNKAFR